MYVYKIDKDKGKHPERPGKELTAPPPTEKLANNVKSIFRDVNRKVSRKNIKKF